MPQTREVALDHYAQRQTFVNATAEVAGQMWSEVDPRDLVNSWAQQVPELTAVVSGAQLGAARQADPYTTDVLEAEGADPEAVSPVDPSGFSGQASDGRGLMSLLTHPVFVTLAAIADGVDVLRALGFGRANLDMIARTQVADAGRLADQVALTTRPTATGYVRVAVGSSCARCLILAGKTYEWNRGFKRHPRCDCIHLPTAIANARRLVRDPRDIYADMTRAERLRAGFTLSDQRALAMGADLEQIVNARHRPETLLTAGGRKLTREGTTRRGLAGRRLGAGRGERVERWSVDEIYRVAGDDRAEALTLLFEHGYLLRPPLIPVSGATTVRGLVSPMAAGPARGGTVGRPAPPPAVRPALEAARTSSAVEAVFKAEFRRITGREIRLVTFAGSAATAREHAEGLLRGLERFPDVKLSAISPTRIGPGSTEYGSASGGRVSFNYDWTSPANRKKYLESLQRDVAGWDDGVQEFGLGLFRASSFHPRGTGTPVAVAVHEFGHVLDIETLGYAIRADLDTLIATRTAEAMRLGRPAPETPITGPDDLIMREISGYATKNRHELVAEAFSDVMMNGPAASQLSREIFDLLEAEYRRGVRRVGVPSVVSSSTPAPDLSKLTVAQLRTLARERGITVPTGARKADIVNLLGGSAPVQAAKKVAKKAAPRKAVKALEPAGTVRAMKPFDRFGGGERRIIADGKGGYIGQRRERNSVWRDDPALGGGPTVADILSGPYAGTGWRRVAPRKAIESPDLSKLTVPQLRAVAKERGVKVPAGSRKADIVELLEGGRPRAAAVAPEFRGAMAAGERAKSVADLLAEVDELLGSQASVRALRHRIESRAKVAGTPPRVVAQLLAAVDDPAALRAAVDKAAKAAKLTRVTPSAGELVEFDRRLLEPIGPDIGRGRMVFVIRPGFEATVNGRKVILPGKALEATPAEVAAHRAAIEQAAESARQQALGQAEGTARLLAEVDELLSKKATAVALRERLDPKLIEPGKVFANADPAVLQALRVALESGDMAKLRTAVTRLSTKAKIKATSKAGAKVKYDPDTMDSGGVEIPKGAQVVVVTRGSTVVIDGETVVLTKPRVVLVGKPAPRVAKARPGSTIGDVERGPTQLQVALGDFDVVKRPKGDFVDRAYGGPDGVIQARGEALPTGFRSDLPSIRRGRFALRPGLTPAESRALDRYALSRVADPLNTGLRQGKTSDFGTARIAGQTVDLDQELIELDSAIAAGQLAQDTVLYRGALMRPVDIGKLQVGAITGESGYLSTTTDMLNAFQIINWRRAEAPPGRLPVIFRILAPKGTHVGAGHIEEHEALLARGRRMRVVEVNRPTGKGRTRLITLELLPDTPS